MNCGRVLRSHPGTLMVVPDASNPDAPAVFGSGDCAQRWLGFTPTPQPRTVPEPGNDELLRAFKPRDVRRGLQGPIRMRFKDGVLVESGLMDMGVGTYGREVQQ